MRGTTKLLRALALTAGLGLFAPQAKADVWMTPVAPPVVCNAYGCWNAPVADYRYYAPVYRPYWGWRHRPYWGWHHRWDRDHDRDWHRGWRR